LIKHRKLGIVYNVSRDYAAAATAFRSALELDPQNYSLWNKLGATLANANLSDEALPAYHVPISFDQSMHERGSAWPFHIPI
jgi:Flp pilus assembly protein TadD